MYVQFCMFGRGCVLGYGCIAINKQYNHGFREILGTLRETLKLEIVYKILLEIQNTIQALSYIWNKGTSVRRE